MVFICCMTCNSLSLNRQQVLKNIIIVLEGTLHVVFLESHLKSTIKLRFDGGITSSSLAVEQTFSRTVFRISFYDDMLHFQVKAIILS
jgi:hypothetical protein